MSYKQYSKIENLYKTNSDCEKQNVLQSEFSQSKFSQPSVAPKCLEIKNIYDAGNTYLTNSLCYKPIILPAVNYFRIETRSPYDNRPWCSYK